MLKMIVCIKAVPEYVDTVAVTPGQSKVTYETTRLYMNESDEYALEQAVVLKKQYGGEILLITLGTLKSQNVLYEGLARGADKAVRINADIVDPNRISRVLTALLKGVEYDLILTGVESRDTMASQVGVSIATKLGIPFAYAVTEVSRLEGEKTVRIVKELGGGIGQVMEISLPALLCIQSGAVPQTYTSSHKILKARLKPIQSVSLDDLGVYVEEEMKFIDIFPPKERRQVEFIEGEGVKAAAELLQKIDKIRREF